MSKYHIFDFDNTIVFTDSLNNESYNHALNIVGLSPVFSDNRITRDVIAFHYPKIGDRTLKNIIQLKQDYYIQNLNKTKLNEGILDIIKCETREVCFLWTSAEKKRVESTLEFHSICDLFADTFFSNKTNLKDDIYQISKKLASKQKELVFYEDNLDTARELSCTGVEIVYIDAGEISSLAGK